jgi:hypothetical protein
MLFNFNHNNIILIIIKKINVKNDYINGEK